jgi:hypothetical protein
MNIIFEKNLIKNLKIYITNDCAKTPKIMWENKEKTTTWNVVIIPMKTPCGEKSRNTHYLY